MVLGLFAGFLLGLVFALGYILYLNSNKLFSSPSSHSSTPPVPFKLPDWVDDDKHPSEENKGNENRLHLIYSPHCPGCKAAIPRLNQIRSELKDFRFTKSMSGPKSVKWVPTLMVERKDKDLEVLSGNEISLQKIVSEKENNN